MWLNCSSGDWQADRQSQSLRLFEFQSPDDWHSNSTGPLADLQYACSFFFGHVTRHTEPSNFQVHFHRRRKNLRFNLWSKYSVYYNQIKLKQTKKHSAWSGITSRGHFRFPKVNVTSSIFMMFDYKYKCEVWTLSECSLSQSMSAPLRAAAALSTFNVGHCFSGILHVHSVVGKFQPEPDKQVNLALWVQSGANPGTVHEALLGRL